MKQILHAASAALLLLCACTQEPVAPANAKLLATPSLDVITLGSGPTYLPRPGFQYGSLEDVNNDGASVGTLVSNELRAVKYVGGQPRILNTPLGHQSQANGINDQGYVVGSLTAQGITRAVYWRPTEDLIELNGNGSARAIPYDVNENNLIVGFIQNSSGATRAGYWDLAGRFTELPLPDDAQGSEAHAVNDNGDIVGRSYFTNTQDERPTLWKRAAAYVPQLLKLPEGISGGFLRDISNSGMMVGSVTSLTCNPSCFPEPTPAVWLNPDSPPAVLSSAGRGVALGVSETGTVVGATTIGFAWSPESGILTLSSTPSGARAINDAGDVVGHDRPPGSVQEPTLWSVVVQPDETDRDGDGIPDGIDQCPDDRENDVDQDGYCGNVDNAPNEANADQRDLDGDGVGDVADVCPNDAENDVDQDGHCGDVDNAPHVENPDQADTDSDHIADVIDACPRDSHNDEDGDGRCGDVDNAPLVYNPGQEDGDRDGIGDVADNCAAISNSDQRDEDRDGVGDACDRTAPIITELTGPTAPLPLVSGSATARIGVSFIDPDALDTHEAEFRCGNGVLAVIPVPASGRGVQYDCSYTQPGVYTAAAIVRDGTGLDTETFEFVVVYDPSAGFVTGGGWINYNGSACPVLCGSTGGRADFGFVSKYIKGATVPSGDTRFEFHTGTLKFASTSYEWLVVAGGKGQFKGRGTINGNGDYGFLLTAVDGSVDKFRIKIWDRSAGEANPLFDTGADIQLDKISGGGSIVIHAR